MIVTYDELIKLPDAAEYKPILELIALDMDAFYKAFPVLKPVGIKKCLNYVRFILEEDSLALIGYFIFGVTPNSVIDVEGKGFHILLYAVTTIIKDQKYYNEIEEALQSFGLRIFCMAKTESEIETYNRFFSEKIAIVKIDY